MTLLNNTVLLLSLAVLCATANPVPTPVGDAPVPTPVPGLLFTLDNSDLEAKTGPLPSRWLDPARGRSVFKDHREQAWQRDRVAFRQFSEKAVSSHCFGLLGPTLDHLDFVRDHVHDRLLAKESNDLLGPIIGHLEWPLSLMENFYLRVKLTEEEIEEDKRRYNLDEKKEVKDPLPSASLVNGTMDLRESVVSYSRTIYWTEEKEPRLLFKYRLRLLEKNMAHIPYVLRFASDPVRQELEESGFIQRTKVLREEARSLLACEGASHVTLAQLDEEPGGYESDNFIDREAARKATRGFESAYYDRLLNHEMNSRMRSLRPAVKTARGTRNITQVVDRVPTKKPLEDKQQLKVQKEEDALLFETPDVKFEWTWEMIVQLWKATRDEYQDNPELAAVLF